MDEDARGAELGQPARALGDRSRSRRCGRGCRRGPASNSRSAAVIASAASRQVGDVVERVVQPEDVDAAVGRDGDEAADDVDADGPRADEEAAAERERERRLRPRLDRADPLPRALDAALDRAVEAASAGDLEIGEPGRVEDLGDPQQLRGRHRAGERLLPEQAQRRVDEPRHAGLSLPLITGETAGFPRGPPSPRDRVPAPLELRRGKATASRRPRVDWWSKRSGAGAAGEAAHQLPLRLVHVRRLRVDDQRAERGAELPGDVLLEAGELDEVAVRLLAEVEAVRVDDELEPPAGSQKSSMLMQGM